MPNPAPWTVATWTPGRRTYTITATTTSRAEAVAEAERQRRRRGRRRPDVEVLYRGTPMPRRRDDDF